MNVFNSNYRALQIAAIYLLIGALWILFSDLLLLRLFTANVPDVTLTLYQTWKGWFFVVTTAALLFLLVRRSHEVQNRTLNKLSSAEKRYRELIQNVPVGIYHTNHAGLSVYLNAQSLEYLGMTTTGQSESAPQKKWLELIHPDDQARVMTAWQQAVRMGAQFHEEYRICIGETPIRWIVDVAHPETDDDGRFVGYLGTLTDISDLRVTQQIEHELHERLQAAIESAHVGLWDLSLQTNEMWYSEEWKQQLGYRGDEIGNRLSEWQTRLHPDDAEQASRALQWFIRHPDEDLHSEFRLRHKDGGYRWILSQASIFYEDGKATRILGTHTDITRIKENESNLRESRERVQHLMEASPTVLYTMRIQGQKVTPNWVSDSITRLFGYSTEEVLQQHWWSSHLHPEDRESAIQETRRLLSDGNIRHDYRFFDKSGQMHWIRDTVRMFQNDDGQQREAIGSWLDITEQRQEEEKMRLYAAAFDSINEGVIVTGMDLIIQSVNKAALSIFGYSEEELLGAKPSIFSSGRHTRKFFASMNAALLGTGAWHGEIWNRHKDGTVQPQWLSVSVLYNNSGKPERYVAIYTDISDLKKTEAELKYLAHYDALTELPNRILLGSRLQHALHTARRQNTGLAVLFIDLDDFKSVNDSMGHTIGDELLVAVAGRLDSRVRDQDTLSRQGGDEFVLLAEHLKSPDEAGLIARDLLNVLKGPFILSNNVQVYAEACIGVAVYPDNGSNVEDLMRNADTAMYKAKKQGRNKFCFYEEGMGSAVIEQLELETALRQGLEKNELMLQYQPKLDLVTGAMTGAEALVRWQRPGVGMVPPDRFIPIAERSGLIVPIGEWVLRTVCQQIRAWLDAGYNPLSIAVNVSARQFRAADLHRLIVDTLQEFAVPPELISLEITETALMENAEEVREILREIKALGVGIALDDFGTGFSNMAYLSRFSLDVLKIDTSFVAEIDVDHHSRNLVDSVIDLAHNLNLRTVAEGVETEAQFEYLQEKGCDEIQGYYYSRPLDLAIFSEWLRQGGKPQPPTD
ncbi:MAG: EAL domain-containing protein [Gammaproteobacteria bacterium]|nr:EAL domain-containing protein [Gammaproteobacteria bacterium]MDP2348578.1 EAL domain-containing protein [Gammaproteobacteria bacterium]